ncbi:MAG: glycosyltransferase family 2 protein [Flavobacterium sp.]|uniref:glycosyltransferase family 2 protein n=1 Tax=Flavobacterium sp. TaxID=239 RepID=UPI002632B00C|nr:glycosyltransferase family 2 protein [Flavobacterium sp.]MDD5152037.1 glycosyltransferase family 2 protein [Flavobacterium sp.]
MNLFKIYIVIVAYNGMHWIEKCLNSVLNSSIFVSVIVVDNYSEDGTVDYIKTNFTEVFLSEQNENLGFGKANNIGISLAMKNKADYVFLLNQDAWVEIDTIEKLIKAHQKEQYFGIVSPMHLNGNGDAFDTGFLNYISGNRCENLVSDMFLDDLKETIYPIHFINAAGWLLSKKCIETVGGFSPSFFHYGEDENYIQRTKYHNLSVGVLANSIIFHDREFRSGNAYFDNKLILYERNIIHKASNPFIVFSIGNEYSNLIKKGIIALLKFNFKEIRTTFLKFKILGKMDKKGIVNNKLISKSIGKSFLE